MPRLLLVDDNQRIHQIVETLLTATDIELTCASSGAEAMDLVASGGPFDVALLDTTMQGMDGWELLDHFRRNDATAMLPIAMMAGVLDVVDPETVRKAPIQGFLKKPVELRDLAERVRALLATPVEPPAPEPGEPPAAAQTFETLPHLKLSEHPLPDADLLILEPSDLYLEEASIQPPEPAPAETPFDAPLESLELEELDLESLKGLPAPPAALEAGEVDAAATGTFPEISPEDAYQSGVLELGVITDELPDLGPSLDLTEETVSGIDEPDEPAEPAEAAPLPEPAPSLPSDWSDESETLLEFTRGAEWPEPDREESPAATAQSMAAAAMEDHSDFDPDSFLDQEAGPAPTPAFLPVAPGQPTPAGVPELAEAELLVEADAIPDLKDLSELDDTLEAAGRDTIPPWANPTGLLDGIPPISPEEAVAPPRADEDLPPIEVQVPAVNDVLPAIEVRLPAAEDVPAPLEVRLPAMDEAVPAVGAPEPGTDPLAALLADPVLMDRLAKAVVARLGDQALREIAWEVMPEMADRLHRN